MEEHDTSYTTLRRMCANCAYYRRYQMGDGGYCGCSSSPDNGDNMRPDDVCRHFYPDASLL
jgi:hypothetical protein